jgi:hypothetical protein
MNSQINRSFSPFQESDESRIGDDYWFRLPSRSGLLWSDLLKKRLVVILGEVGIGKTFEFQNEAKTLASENQAAFFLPLNLITVYDPSRHLYEWMDNYRKRKR